MLGPKKKRGLYYLLPGMNRSNRIRQRQILRWSIVVGLVCALLFGLLIYWLNSPSIRYNW
jgi:high-affinity Fe2+/Pb2+ permease